MKKQKIAGKTILKIIGALLAVAYLGFCLYAGITGKIPAMHKLEHVMRFGKLKNWVSGGIVASMVFALCVGSALNDLNIWKQRKKSVLPIFLMGILPVIAILLLAAYLDIGWSGIVLYVCITAILCGMACIPTILNKAIASLLLKEGPISGKQRMRIIEWIHFYPLKKLLLLGLWGFGVVLVLRGIWVISTGELAWNSGILLFLFIILALVIGYFKKLKRYLCTPYHSVPVLNQILDKSQIERLIEGEQFEPFQFKDADMQRDQEVYQSKNWMLIQGKLFSKKLTLQASIDCGKRESRLEVLYLNGMTAKTTLGLELKDSIYEGYCRVKEELEGHIGPLVIKEEEQLAQKFETFFPDCPSEQARMNTFLMADVTEIRQEYIQAFTPPDTSKKKHSRRKQQQ